MTKKNSEEINDWADALDNLLLFNGKEEASEIIQSFVEAGFKDDAEDDPYVVSSPQNILKYLKEESKVAV